MNARDLTALVHLVGFTTGIILYAMLAVMTRRRPSYVVAPRDEHTADRLPLVAAIFGVVWNVGAMLVYAARDFGIAYPMAWVGAVAYSALGLLPAVVVHSTITRTGRGGYRWLLAVAYVGSAAAAVLHVAGASRGETPSAVGLLLLTITYAALVGVLAVTERRRAGFQRTLTAVALAAFAVSALHLSQRAGVVDEDPWAIELIGHHASLPLVLAILYQDYRFAFSDLFLKRALAVLVLAGLVSLLYATLAAPLVDPHAIAARQSQDDGSHLFATEALLALWIATALAYPFIQRRVFRFVDRVILRRADYRELRGELGRRLASASDANEALDVTCSLLARALGATNVTWHSSAARGRGSYPTITLDARRTEAGITIPTAIEPSFEIQLSPSTSGRSLLSDDLMLIDAVAAAVGRRIDEVRIDAERITREQREREMQRLATEAELRALRAQLNPHFLFNALNTLGHLMQVAPDRAMATLYRLTALLRAVLRRSNGQFVALNDELDILESYLAIEHERFHERLTVSIDIPAELRSARIPPLLLQPLVENAIKHGIAPRKEGGRVVVRALRDAADVGDEGFLRLFVVDSGGPWKDGSDGNGVGLANIENRLRLYYGAAAAVTMRRVAGGETTVEVVVPWVGHEQSTNGPDSALRSE
jgi:two-component system, LytTR family, sensor kinase